MTRKSTECGETMGRLIFNYSAELKKQSLRKQMYAKVVEQ